MDKSLQKKVNKYSHKNRLKNVWKRMLSIMGCIVVFCTTYALILPAITQEREVHCHMAEHVHTQSCFEQQAEWRTVMDCGAHVHTDACLNEEGEIGCGQAAVAHLHDEKCYDSDGKLRCALPENPGHTHNENCYEIPDVQVQAAAVSETVELSCNIPENHTHGAACSTERKLICADEAHEHDDGCYAAPELICEVPEGHVHGDGCYAAAPAEPVAVSAEPVLVCRLPETKLHVHGDACISQVAVEPALTCDRPEDGTHSHSAMCYGTWTRTCVLPEHTHIQACYSDPDADLETETDWEKTFKDVSLTGVWADDLLSIAETQLGYQESTKNFVVLEDGETVRGYTRYGEWYGSPYDEWSAMFIQFCLHYAEVEGLPQIQNCQEWLDALPPYAEADSGYEPLPGDLVFFDTDEDEAADRVGIVTAYGSKLKTIEGDWENEVKRASYDRKDPTIVGYVPLPVNEMAPDAEGGMPVAPAETPEAAEPMETVVPMATVEPLATVEPAVTDEPTVEIEPTATPEPIAEIEPTATPEPIAEIEPTATPEPIAEIEPEATDEPITMIEPTAEPLLGADGDEIFVYEEESVIGVRPSDGLAENEPGYTGNGQPIAGSAPMEVVLVCGKDEHFHDAPCFDENANLICGYEEHIHTDVCYVIPLPEYYCGREEHMHDATCYDEAANLICGSEEHIHTDACMVEIITVYYCGCEEHIHDTPCFDENANLICGCEEHIHTDACLSEVVYHCGLDEHVHSEACSDENGEWICGLEAHEHEELCQAPDGHLCWQTAHEHDAECVDADGNLVCVIEPHVHTIACTVNMRGLNRDLRRQLAEVILLIEDLPTVDMIFERIDEYEAVEDYAGEEAWLTELYQQVGHVYERYSMLPAEAQMLVFNQDKLLEMDFIWSRQVLVDTVIGNTVNYSNNLFNSNSRYIVYTQQNGQYYAFDGNGNAVPINISNGTITARIGDNKSLLWTFTRTSNNSNTYRIYNEVTKRYMHAYSSSDGSSVTSSGNYTSVVVASGSGAKIRSNDTQYARLDAENRVFRVTSTPSEGAVFSFGLAPSYTVWLDGTNGGRMALTGSPDTKYTVNNGSFVLPQEWQSPSKYAYKLRGWYDIINGKYYLPGTEVPITGNTVFYADWEAASYNIGQFNEHVADTVSTNDFITTRMFDYGTLFNLESLTLNPSVSANDHTETWRIDNTTQPFPYIFRDWDTGGEKFVSWPVNSNNQNTNGGVYSGLYSQEWIDKLFGTSNEYNPETGEGVLGKRYIGTGDHLFQYGTDPNEPEHYGYYYYDSNFNAASYNQSERRFYVYDYLERLSDSAGAEVARYSDFVPFNSPYANTNGKRVQTYTYNGLVGEYNGVTHYQYDSKYNESGSSANNVGANFWFGMSVDMKFFLPNKPGTTDDEGNPANKSLFGDDLVFEFSGDDDVWVLVDGKLVLDLGGIHGVESGSIDFSTGVVKVNGSNSGNVRYLEPGEHVLTLYYLERGSSQSNCKMRFNLSPRYKLDIQKEDVLTRHLLNGAQFSVYVDAERTQPAELWPSQASHDRNDPPTNVFTVENGIARIWGFPAGATYYIEETRPPSNGYSMVDGIIKMRLNNVGKATYEILPDPDSELESGITGGFTVHGFKVDMETQEAFLVVTNGQNVTETTSIQAWKVWDDNLNHDDTPVTVYLLADGIRIREDTLSDANNWSFTWENLPKYQPDGVTEVVYEVQEGVIPGYVGRIEQVTEKVVQTEGWKQVDRFTNGKIYLLQSGQGYLEGGTDNKAYARDREYAETHDTTKWRATVSGNNIRLTNEAGRTIYHQNYRFRIGTSTGTNANLQFNNRMFTSNQAGHTRYMCNISTEDNTINSVGTDYSGYLDAAEKFTLYEYGSVETRVPVEGTAFQIVNTPVGNAPVISLTVYKDWDLGTHGSENMYRDKTVYVEILSNGQPSGVTVPISYKNGWKNTFYSLPKYDADGKEIQYSIREEHFSNEWSPQYGEIKLAPSGNNAYEIDLVNVCTLTYQLPATGGAGTEMYTTGGLLLVAAAGAALLYSNRSKRRKEGSHSL